MRRLATRFAALALAPAAAAQLTVVSVDPPLNASNRAPNTPIRVAFDRALEPASLGSFRVYGSVGGRVEGAVFLASNSTLLCLDPARAFAAGELVTIVLDEQLQAEDDSYLRSEGFVASFRVRSAAAPMSFTQIQTWDTDPQVFARVYGAQSCDVDGDEFPDLSLICENTSDVRVHLNTADGSGLFQPMLQPANGTGSTPSPNESWDMDRDGHLDLVTCDVGGSSVSVLLGNGDGTFQPALTYAMGNDPRGLALLDVDGDGDQDVVTANSGAGNLTLRRNNGDGTLGSASSFQGGVSGEWGLQAADMDRDGVADLVCGGQWSHEVAVLLGNGDGTFDAPIVRFAGGAVWQIALGDVNGDGLVDVTCANGGSGNGSVLRGNGDGTLQPAATYPAGGHATATDLGDLDGDGDLDWVLSSFGGGQWRIYRNDGAGGFAAFQTIPAVSNPACSVILDVDGDRDLDLALLDEIDDTARILENGALDQLVFCAGDGSGSACPCGNAGVAGHGCEHSFGTGGGLLLAQGLASVADDRLVLNASGLPPATSVLFFEGATPLAGGMGQTFGDGLRCIAQPTIRLGLEATSLGFASFGHGLGDPPISVKGMVPANGGTFYYQGWFRNPASYCNASTFNLTNGLRVTWTP
jgi:hypothetical protein